MRYASPTVSDDMQRPVRIFGRPSSDVDYGICTGKERGEDKIFDWCHTFRAPRGLALALSLSHDHANSAEGQASLAHVTKISRPSASRKTVRTDALLRIDIAALRARLTAARLPDLATRQADRARRLLLAWIGSAEADGQTAETILRALASGAAAAQIGAALRAQMAENPPPVVRDAACAPGCAFCCILTGEDGGTITGAEARALHAALAPLIGQPDGRAWHPMACPALDPATRTCRAYDARPAICRSYLSTDARACEVNAAGGSAAGAGVLGAHLDYLAVHALVRAALAGTVKVHSYALREVAAAALAGQDAKATLDSARHPTRMLDRAHAGLAAAASKAR